MLGRKPFYGIIAIGLFLAPGAYSGKLKAPLRGLSDLDALTNLALPFGLYPHEDFLRKDPPPSATSSKNENMLPAYALHRVLENKHKLGHRGDTRFHPMQTLNIVDQSTRGGIYAVKGFAFRDQASYELEPSFMILRKMNLKKSTVDNHEEWSIDAIYISVDTGCMHHDEQIMEEDGSYRPVPLYKDLSRSLREACKDCLQIREKKRKTAALLPYDGRYSVVYRLAGLSEVHAELIKLTVDYLKLYCDHLIEVETGLAYFKDILLLPESESVKFPNILAKAPLAPQKALTDYLQAAAPKAGDNVPVIYNIEIKRYNAVLGRVLDTFYRIDMYKLGTEEKENECANERAVYQDQKYYLFKLFLEATGTSGRHKYDSNYESVYNRILLFIEYLHDYESSPIGEKPHHAITNRAGTLLPVIKEENKALEMWSGWYRILQKIAGQYKDDNSTEYYEKLRACNYMKERMRDRLLMLWKKNPTIFPRVNQTAEPDYVRDSIAPMALLQAQLAIDIDPLTWEEAEEGFKLGSDLGSVIFSLGFTPIEADFVHKTIRQLGQYVDIDDYGNVLKGKYRPEAVDETYLLPLCKRYFNLAKDGYKYPTIMTPKLICDLLPKSSTISKAGEYMKTMCRNYISRLSEEARSSLNTFLVPVITQLAQHPLIKMYHEYRDMAKVDGSPLNPVVLTKTTANSSTNNTPNSSNSATPENPSRSGSGEIPVTKLRQMLMKVGGATEGEIPQTKQPAVLQESSKRTAEAFFKGKKLAAKKQEEKVAKKSTEMLNLYELFMSEESLATKIYLTNCMQNNIVPDPEDLENTRHMMVYEGEAENIPSDVQEVYFYSQLISEATFKQRYREYAAIAYQNHEAEQARQKQEEEERREYLELMDDVGYQQEEEVYSNIEQEEEEIQLGISRSSRSISEELEPEDLGEEDEPRYNERTGSQNLVEGW